MTLQHKIFLSPITPVISLVLTCVSVYFLGISGLVSILMGLVTAFLTGVYAILFAEYEERTTGRMRGATVFMMLLGFLFCAVVFVALVIVVLCVLLP